MKRKIFTIAILSFIISSCNIDLFPTIFIDIQNTTNYDATDIEIYKISSSSTSIVDTLISIHVLEPLEERNEGISLLMDKINSGERIFIQYYLNDGALIREHLFDATGYSENWTVLVKENGIVVQ